MRLLKVLHHLIELGYLVPLLVNDSILVAKHLFKAILLFKEKRSILHAFLFGSIQSVLQLLVLLS